MLRDWTDSDKINTITVHAERFFVRLIMKVDDYGCFYADYRLLKANLFPLLLDTIREADITRWMAECQKAGLIVLYEVNSKRYLRINDFKQRLDKARAKYPLPPDHNDFPELVNDCRAEVEVETEVERKKKEAPAAPAPQAKKKKTRENFVPPTKEQMQEYFITLMANQWGEAKCKTQSDACLDHYVANGWVQNKNKPIVDWKAAARNWIRRELSGEFSNHAPPEKQSHTAKPVTANASTPKPVETKISEEEKEKRTREFVQDLYLEYLSGGLRFEFISTGAYDYLKSIRKMKVPEGQAAKIAAEAKAKRITELKASSTIEDKKLLAAYVDGSDVKDQGFLVIAKRLSLLQFFEDAKIKNKKNIFE